MNARDLRRLGFKGFLTVRVLRATDLESVPEVAGVYAVIRPGRSAPRFRRSSPAGRFKGRDPTLHLRELRDRWLRQADIVYMGKAGGARQVATLRSRIRAYLRHGAGARAAHWGGRAIWQLADADSLLIAWLPTLGGVPRDVERGLIDKFTSRFGFLPFANRSR